MKRTYLVVVIVMLFTLEHPVGAWGPEGHRIVAHIAELRLSDVAHQALAHILADGEQISDNMICNWPDYVRRDQPETGPWHYVSIPKGAEFYDEHRYCPEGQCIVHQIHFMEAIVADESKSLEDRKTALRFLVHFLGDVHQPLHCADYDDDRGGNERLVIYPGQDKPTKLHAVWDSNIVRELMNPLGPLVFADKLNARISSRRARQWARGTPEDWAWESHQLAMKYAYAVVPPKDGPPMALDTAYVKVAKKVAEQQLMKAGVRLAEALNRSLINVPAEVIESSASSE
ncbi:MAG TPA: S1/P1 nuclease [Kiritimatiellia bacterium]|nr:S1/P1 nuclease [Kiritimatiellia bacterium]